MNADVAISYFSRLLQTKIDKDTIIKLSSGQAARAHAWLSENNFKVGNVNFSGGFTISQVVSDDVSLLADLESSASLKSELHYSDQAFVGIDIQSISELFPAGLVADPKSDQELLSVYSLKELSYAQSKPNPKQTLAGIFAAKEAIIKCSNIALALSEIEVLPDVDGRPYHEDFSVSISHSGDFAIAVAIHKPSVENISQCICSNRLELPLLGSSKSETEVKYFSSLLLAFFWFSSVAVSIMCIKFIR